MTEARKTPLYDLHKECGAKTVDFGGWEMPVSYSGVLKEHEAVRTGVGIFDVSHMGEIFISGQDAAAFTQLITSNDVDKLQPGRGQYSLLLNEDGGIIDDLFVYQIQENVFMLCVNASNTAKDWKWIQKQKNQYNSTAEISNESDNWSQLAIQGPESQNELAELIEATELERFKDLPFTGISEFKILDSDVLVARTGYTGEWGYELYCKSDAATKIWKSLVLRSENPVTPCGLGCRDTLRLESCYPLFGQEMDESVNPFELGVGWAVKTYVEDFIGKKALLAIKENGHERQVVAFKLEDRGIARQGMHIQYNDSKIGLVTSGSHLPTLGFAGGMALVKSGNLNTGDSVQIDVRGKLKNATILKKPLYSPRVK